MTHLIYLSAPYSSSDPRLRRERALACSRIMVQIIASGRLVICPLVMNHAALDEDKVSNISSAYWSALEGRLATACDQLVVLKLAGWGESKGVGREIAFFKVLGKPVEYWDAEINVTS